MATIGPPVACSSATCTQPKTSSCRRCVRCKSQAYCSKECQIQAWPTHRAVCAMMTCAQKWRELEAQWWRQLPPNETLSMVAEGLDPLAMAFYGEVYFALCNLKPCVMLTGIPHHLQPSFLQNVIRASNVLDLNMLSLVQAGPVSTLSFDFSGTFVLVTLGHPLASELVVALSTPTSMQVSETTVARWLDYPVALDTCVDTSAMVEIGYFDITTDQLVTSYCATFHDPNHRRQILDHFQRYTQTLGSILQLRRDATSV